MDHVPVLYYLSVLEAEDVHAREPIRGILVDLVSFRKDMLNMEDHIVTLSYGTDEVHGAVGILGNTPSHVSENAILAVRYAGIMLFVVVPT